MLRGRREQCEVLDGMLADVRAGRSRVLVVRGEPGIGKTALLGYAADTAQDFQVAEAEGVESEMELPYAALQQLCSRMLSRLDVLPGLWIDRLDPPADRITVLVYVAQVAIPGFAGTVKERHVAAEDQVPGLPGLLRRDCLAGRERETGDDDQGKEHDRHYAAHG